MLKPAAILFALLSFVYVPVRPVCDCQRVGNDVTTHSGFERVVVTSKTYVKELKGTVTAPVDQAMRGVLVEIFDHPEILSMRPGRAKDERLAQQWRLAACETGEDGKFCFPEILPGTYELRMSAVGFDPISMIVVLSPYKSTAEDEIEMELNVSN